MKLLFKKASIIFVASALFFLVACTKNTENLAKVENVKVEEQKLVWDEVANADYYEVYISNVEGSPFKVEANEFALYEKIVAGVEYSIQVKALSNNEKFLASELSAEVKHLKYGQQKLASPVVTYAENKLSWEAVEGADSYLIEIGNYRINTKELSFEDDGARFKVEKVYEAKISAISAVNKELNSVATKIDYILHYRFVQAPVLSLEGSVITWEAVECATSYLVVVDDVEVEVKTLSIDLAVKFPKLKDGEYEVTVTAYNPAFVYNLDNAKATLTYVKQTVE
ncbi:hypothetical protein [Acholeplasma hippikon]|uniref:Fibronectin type-III domain-containing protein n=1 Tax=Acholeplasma hippikon TaxID=264636 RepID=A0A449BI68_9MOLU|nr:hypothetical protein [Acholeplasma hippikon]VEU82138.1 Uncharacterised protein [Acholeplasma hippikon]